MSIASQLLKITSSRSLSKRVD